MICPHCSYEWVPRKEHPKSCPMCKRYLQKRIKSTVDLGLMPKFPVHVNQNGEIDGVGMPTSVLLENPNDERVK